MATDQGPAGRNGLWLVLNAAHRGDDCLIWPFSFDTKGYGQVKFDGKIRGAHRVMCELVNGPAPSPDHEASHSCGRGGQGCVNPSHLEWKTRSQNQLDRRAHGTAKTGIGSASRRTNEETEAIRRAIGTATVTTLARRFKVSRRTVERIRDGAKPRPLSQDPRNVRRRLDVPLS